MARSEASVAPAGPLPMMPAVWIEFLVATQKAMNGFVWVAVESDYARLSNPVKREVPPSATILRFNVSTIQRFNDSTI
jgi:hypothetical protein